MTTAQREIVLTNAEWARGLARSRKRRSSTCASLDDMKSAAVLGLCQAARRFDPARGVSFRSYTARRIRGAIIDEIRAASGMTKRKPRAGADVRIEVDVVVCDERSVVECSIHLVGDKIDIKRALSVLTDRQRRVVEMTILHGMLLREAAAVLRIKIHSASELRLRALARMREVMRDRKEA